MYCPLCHNKVSKLVDATNKNPYTDHTYALECSIKNIKHQHTFYKAKDFFHLTIGEFANNEASNAAYQCWYAIGMDYGNYYITINDANFDILEFEICDMVHVLHRYLKLKAFQ
jgi:hypothetical protein